MKRLPWFSLSILTCLILSLSGSRVWSWPGTPASAHVQLAEQYVADITPANNRYDSPCSISYIGGVLKATSKCGSFAAYVHRASYSGLTSTVMTNLFGSGSPNAQQWYAGLANKTKSGSYGCGSSYFVQDIDCGDVLAAVYSTSSGATGHVMICNGLMNLGDVNLSGDDAIPGYPDVDLWLVNILDCTSSPHDPNDDRTLADVAVVNGKTVMVDDEGIGAAQIYVIADQTTGGIVGWTWSTSLNRVYQCVDPVGVDANGNSNYRPMISGYLYGPGIQ